MRVRYSLRRHGDSAIVRAELYQTGSLIARNSSRSASGTGERRSDISRL